MERVERCGITCFDITFRPTTASAEVVYPLEMPLAEPETLTVECGAEPSEIEVRPVDELGPTWDGRTTGCEAVLAFGRWMSYSPYYHFTAGDVAKFTQTPRPWAAPLPGMTCFGDPTSPPACDMSHESAPIHLMTIESVTAVGTDVVISGVEWDVQWVGEYVDHGPIGDLIVVVGCDTIVDAESERGEGWVRILDACLLAQLFASGEAFPGIYATYGENSDMIWGLDHVAEIELP